MCFSIHVNYVHFCSDLCFPTSKVLFIAIVLFSRIKSFCQNLCSRPSKNSLSVSKLETRSSKLGYRTSKIKTRNSSLETRFSILENFEDWESRLSTYIWAVLYLYITFLCAYEKISWLPKVREWSGKKSSRSEINQGIFFWV